jgi:uncharacterized protein YecE (DUF72 family)
MGFSRVKPKIWIGTGAVAFQEWKGKFYPRDLPASDALGYYAQTFSTLELNSTFYRMPTAAAIKAMVRPAPAGFPFAVKMPQFITHLKRLKNCAQPTRRFFKLLTYFGDHLGPALVQLPPNLKDDLPRLEEFFATIPAGFNVAVEFRHPSWFKRPVFDFLKKKNAALVFNDTDVDMPFVSTADWGFLRLRHLAYTDAELKTWARTIRKQNWSRAFAIFKHEKKATAPRLARRFREFI